MKIISKNIEDLKPYEKNPKKHTNDQIRKVADSIKKFGFYQPFVIDKKNVIVVGHCRFEAAKTLKLKTLPCLIMENLTDDELKALRIADNKLNESIWNMELVFDEFKSLNIEMQELTGFENSEFKIDLKNVNKEIDIDNLKTEHECPKCGFTF